MDGEELCKFIQGLILDGNIITVVSDMYRDSYGNIINTPNGLGIYKCFHVMNEVKITLTDFRRLQNLVHEFNGTNDIREFINGFNGTG